MNHASFQEAEGDYQQRGDPAPNSSDARKRCEQHGPRDGRTSRSPSPTIQRTPKESREAGGKDLQTKQPRKQHEKHAREVRGESPRRQDRRTLTHEEYHRNRRPQPIKPSDRSSDHRKSHRFQQSSHPRHEDSRERYRERSYDRHSRSGRSPGPSAPHSPRGRDSREAVSHDRPSEPIWGRIPINPEHPRGQGTFVSLTRPFGFETSEGRVSCASEHSDRSCSPPRSSRGRRGRYSKGLKKQIESFRSELLDKINQLEDLLTRTLPVVQPPEIPAVISSHCSESEILDDRLLDEDGDAEEMVC